MDPLHDEILAEVARLQSVPHAERAALFESRAEALAPGGPGRAAWLSHAGEAWELAGDLGRARACYEAAVEDGGDTYLDPRAELLGVVLDLGEPARAAELLTELEQGLRDGHRHGEFVHETVGEALEMHGHPEEALRWFDAGLSASERDSPADLDIGCLNGRFRVRRTLGLPMDRYDEICEARRAGYADELDDDDLIVDGPDLPRGPDDRSVPLTVVHWPPGELEPLLERWPTLAEDYGTDHDEHRARVEQRLRHLAGAHPRLAVGRGRVQELATFAAERDEDPRQHLPRGLYAAHLALEGRTTPWPPGRDEPCWCGSGVAYASCCGTAASGPDAGTAAERDAGPDVGA